MESPIKQYKKLRDIDGIKDIAYNEIFWKYIQDNIKGDAKLTQIDSTNQESLLMSLNGGRPIPGCIYTFIYNHGVVEYIKDNKKNYKFHDMAPIVFCTNVTKTLIKGINFNMLPELERLKFLETYYNLYTSFFKNLEELTDNNKLALNKKFISNAVSKDGMKILDAICKIADANFKFAYRTYKVDNIEQLRLIEYTEWNYLPFINSDDAFTILNQKKIHDMYWRAKK